MVRSPFLYRAYVHLSIAVYFLYKLIWIIGAGICYTFGMKMTDTPSQDMQSSSCANCALAPICLPIGLNEAQMLRVSTLVERHKPVKKGASFVREGSVFSALYAVQSGAFKASRAALYGREQINAFFLPGEIFGFDAIYERQYLSSFIALETSQVCEISFDRLLSMAGEMPDLQKQLFSLMSSKLAPGCTNTRQRSADESMANFVLGLSSRFLRRGCSATCFSLPMSREDIGCYLGLASETISRIMTRFEKNNIISIARREIHILDLRQLQIVACGS
jgi:CRP/FNR family transcriptional regulator, anaerobic regulatory protein